MNHQGTKVQRELPIPEEVNRAGTHVVDGAFAVHSALGPGLLINFNVSFIKDGIKRMAL